MKNTHRSILAVVALAILTVSTATVRAQFNYVTNNGTITITGYTGSGGAVTLPITIHGLPVTTIGEDAFIYCTNMTSITIPNSVNCIGGSAFRGCKALAAVTIGNSVTEIGVGAFIYCINISSITIPNSVTNIGVNVFSGCTGLTNVNIGSGVRELWFGAFYNCTALPGIVIPHTVQRICSEYDLAHPPLSATFENCVNLAAVYFEGDAPQIMFYGDEPFYGSQLVRVYYLPGTTGWTSTFGGRPTAPWVLPYPVILTTTHNFGVQTNQFGFRISWATNASVVVEASTTLANPVWSPVSTNTLTDGWTYFSDVEWTNYPARFYRVRQF